MRRVNIWIICLAAAIVVASLLVAACGGGSTSPTVAGAGSTTSTSTASANGAPSSEADAMLAYSQCMRDHGIKDFPDPDANGGFSLSASPGSDLDPNNPTYQAADEACKALMPKHEFTAEEQAAMRTQNLQYSQCMRAQGITDFPDPTAGGTLEIQPTPGGDLDPDNPKYQAADKACSQYQPKGTGGAERSYETAGSGTGSGGSGQ
jgi:hypothetical protein